MVQVLKDKFAQIRPLASTTHTLLSFSETSFPAYWSTAVPLMMLRADRPDPFPTPSF